MQTRTAVIVDAVRTAGGRRGGVWRDWHPVDLGAEALMALQQRNDLDPAIIDDVITGCVMQVGEQSLNVARNMVLAAGWPDSVPGTTVDRQCGSSQQAMHFAAQGVIAGAYDVVVAAGVEAMSRVPMGSSIADGKFGMPFGPRIEARYETAGGLVPQGLSAELVAESWDLDRERLDEYGALSQQRAHCASVERRFEAEMIPVVGAEGVPVLVDEGIRPDTTVEVLAELAPAFTADGVVTAGNSSQISDGASAVLVMSETRAAALGLRPRARFHGFAVAGADPRMMLTAPIPATRQVLERGGLTLDQIDLVEINEAFASVVLAWEREMHADMERVNVNGGAIALGHPLGASGTRLMATLLNELERTDGRWGLQTMCEGGGTANATIIERLG